MLESQAFPSETFLDLDGSSLSVNTDPAIDRKGSTDLSAFELPQLLVKKGYQQSVQRFRAEQIRNSSVLCSDNFITVHGPADILETAAAIYNSVVAIYYLFLTSSRLGTYRPAVLQHELLGVPMPESHITLTPRTRTFKQIDALVRPAMDLKESEWALIEDRVQYTLKDFFAGPESPARHSTNRSETSSELLTFAEYVIRVLSAAFGARFKASAIVFAEANNQVPLAVRIMAIRLAADGEDGIRTVPTSHEDLYQQLRDFESRSKQHDAAGLSFVPKSVRLYDFVEQAGRRIRRSF